MPALDCRYTDNLDESLDICNHVVTLTQQLNVPANPVHFTLLFEKLSQTDPAFAEQIEELIQQNRYTDESVRPLFLALLKRILHRHLPTEEVALLIESVLNNLDQWTAISATQQQNIERSIECLKSCESPESAITCLHQNVLPSIEQINLNTKQLREQLTNSAEVIRRLKQELEQATNLAKTDALTGIPNRRGFDELIAERITHAKKKQRSFALLLLDLDHFKKINDHFGHLVGDSALRYIARSLHKETKGQDAIARLGGEEFVILLTDIEFNNAMRVAEKIRTHIAAKSLRVKDREEPLRFTISIGVAMYQMGEAADHLFDRADKALYMAKQTGRNRTCGEHQL
jgi:diguanylate cyclase